jgi:2-aminoadipate transaminase
MWQEHYAQRTQRMTNSAVRELLKFTEQPDCISFAGGLPAPEAFPIESVAQATQKVLCDKGIAALQYGPTEGYYPLREWIASYVSESGSTITPENVLITTGSQQGLDLTGKIFLNPGDTVLVESPTYLAALQAWMAYEADFIDIPTDCDGMQTQYLSTLLEANPKFIYCQPNFQNPQGVTLSLSRREELIELSIRKSIPLVEDDPYGALRFEGEHLPRLLTLSHRAQSSYGQYAGNSISLGTFSKLLMPGFRLGWIVAPMEVINRLVQAKQSVDLHTPMLNQIVVHELVSNGILEWQIPRITQLYRERRDTMLMSLAEHFSPDIRWTEPHGGLFIWVTLPIGMDASLLLQNAVREHVAFVPGAPFHIMGGENTLRLNFSNASIPMIRDGIARLGQAISHLSQPVS